MRVNTTKPRTALASGRGKSGEQIKANYRNYITTNLDRDLFLIRAQSVQRQMVQSMWQLAFLYKGGSSI